MIRIVKYHNIGMRFMIFKPSAQNITMSKKINVLQVTWKSSKPTKKE